MERLIVKNFGSIKHIDIELKDVNVFIGYNSTGKSTVAKLLGIFQEKSSLFNDITFFIKKLIDYNINYSLSVETLIRYEFGEMFIEVKNHHISTNIDFDIYDLIIQVIQTEHIDLLINEKDRFQKLLEFNDSFTKNRFNELIKEFDEISEKNLIYGYDKIRKVVEFLKDYLKAAPRLNVKYIPSERVIFPMVSRGIFSFLKNEINIPKSTLSFGSDFEKARVNIKSFQMKWFDMTYTFENSDDLIQLQNGEKILLSKSSSGVQSATPMTLVVEHFSNLEDSYNSFIIEEPELNLYPSTQKKLMEFLIGKINASGNKLTITTHSPYILTSLDNLIQANEVVRMHPQKSEEVEKIVSKELWLDYDKVCCYYFENGTCRDIKDEEFRSIGPNNIDDVSESLGLEFDKLLDLKYGE